MRGSHYPYSRFLLFLSPLKIDIEEKNSCSYTTIGDFFLLCWKQALQHSATEPGTCLQLPSKVIYFSLTSYFFFPSSRIFPPPQAARLGNCLVYPRNTAGAGASSLTQLHSFGRWCSAEGQQNKPFPASRLDWCSALCRRTKTAPAGWAPGPLPAGDDPAAAPGGQRSRASLDFDPEQPRPRGDKARPNRCHLLTPPSPSSRAGSRDRLAAAARTPPAPAATSRRQKRNEPRHATSPPQPSPAHRSPAQPSPASGGSSGTKHSPRRRAGPERGGHAPCRAGWGRTGSSWSRRSPRTPSLRRHRRPARPPLRQEAAAPPPAARGCGRSRWAAPADWPLRGAKVNVCKWGLWRRRRHPLSGGSRRAGGARCAVPVPRSRDDTSPGPLLS